jgi:hypothetical protein
MSCQHADVLKVVAQERLDTEWQRALVVVGEQHNREQKLVPDVEFPVSRGSSRFRG